MKVRDLVITALFIAIGILLPLVMHSLGVGPVFLPMHIVVLLAGIFLPLYFAVLAALAIPVMSSLLTGMPVLFPNLCYMIPELVIYAAVINLLYRRAKWNIHYSLISSMIAGRMMAGVCVWLLVILLGVELPSPLIFVETSVVTGLPGIALQLIIIPAIAIALQKVNSKQKA